MTQTSISLYRESSVSGLNVLGRMSQVSQSAPIEPSQSYRSTPKPNDAFDLSLSEDTSDELVEGLVGSFNLLLIHRSRLKPFSRCLKELAQPMPVS